MISARMISARMLIAALVTFFATSAWGALQPEDIAILANQNSPESQQIAAYYAQKRGIPEAQICTIAIPMGEELSREDWDSSVRPAIRRWVANNRLQDKIRCMVTVWDVPLKIGRRQTPDTTTRRRVRLLQLERKRRMERLLDFVGQFDAIQPSGSPAEVTLNPDSTLQEITQLLSTRLKQAEARIQSTTDEKQKQAGVERLTQLSVATAGLQVVTQNMQRTIQDGRGTERLQTEYQFGRGRLSGLVEAQRLVEGLPATVERDTNLISLIERATGIAGTVGWIDGQLDLMRRKETYASFDSELSLVLESNYQLIRWLPNYLHYNYDGSPLRAITRTLMVSRLEAPTLDLTKQIVDQSMAVEQKGLTGKVYLDARGIAAGGQQPTMEQSYDQSLLAAHKLLTENTDLEVVLNNDAELFAEGACPDAALYCGWTSLSNYIDSFTWVPGAVGYHMADGEASTIRRADSQVWCKQMLERGVVGTIGPVHAPYIVAFPRPHEFFALLCSGRYTFIECIYRTKSTNSWTMTAIGDPLYNPFQAKPALATPPAEYNRLFGIR